MTSALRHNLTIRIAMGGIIPFLSFFFERQVPRQVEAVIADCPGVALVAVVGVPDERWGEVGVAFIESRPGEAVSPDGVKTFLSGRLARFKQPKRIEVLAELPRIGSGKIDKPELTRRATAC